MPPKKKITKTENNEDFAQNASKPIASKASEEASTRVLRARKPAPVLETKEAPIKSKPPVKAKKEKVEKKTVEAQPKTGRGRKPKDSEKVEDEDEPEKKRLKSDDDSDNENNKVDGAKYIYDFTAKDINGKDISLDKYKGHACIIVNVASRCGHTASNYKEFVELYDKYNEEKGLKILAFPCNQFGKQEPGDNEKICEFVKKKNVKFDMFEKIEVNGKNAHPLWKYLKSKKQGPKGENIDWNFTKFLIDKEGQVVERFKPTVKPLALLKDLEKIW